ncbi:MAG: hypothetical protein JNJ47_03280, partial [Alphaproteobacteria bacterium]|nr:hypothetical protein [Alphaproteobacteria bacterium]
FLSSMRLVALVDLSFFSPCLEFSAIESDIKIPCFMQINLPFEVILAKAGMGNAGIQTLVFIIF